MEAIKFDEHIGINLYRALSEDGLSEKDKAKVISEVIQTIFYKLSDLSKSSSKRELSETELRLTKDIRELELQIKKLDSLKG